MIRKKIDKQIDERCQPRKQIEETVLSITSYSSLQEQNITILRGHSFCILLRCR